jgi:hypothetical protein
MNLEVEADQSSRLAITSALSVNGCDGSVTLLAANRGQLRRKGEQVRS